MSNQSLPPRANLPQIRNRAKDLVKAFRDRDARAVALTTTYLPRLNEATDDSLAAATLTLQEAQHVIARQYGFASWRDLLRAHHCLPVLKVLLEAGAKPALLSTIHIGGQMHDTGVRGADRSFIGVTALDYATEFPQEPHSIIPEPGSDSHLPHKSVVQLLRQVLP